MEMRIRLLSAAVLLSLCSPAVQAGPVNGGFESGLGGWTTVGDVLTVDASFGVTPIEGTTAVLLTTSSINGDLHNFSGVDAVGAAALEATLGLAGGSLVGAVEGSAIFQTFTAAVGDVLSFRYNFLSTEGSKDDYAFLSLVGLSTLADVSAATNPSAAALDPVFLSTTSESGWLTFTHTFTAAGPFTLTLGVVDVDDEFEPSALLVDGVSLRTSTTPIPEPGSAVLMGVATALIAASRRLRPRSGVAA